MFAYGMRTWQPGVAGARRSLSLLRILQPVHVESLTPPRTTGPSAGCVNEGELGMSLAQRRDRLSAENGGVVRITHAVKGLKKVGSAVRAT